MTVSRWVPVAGLTLLASTATAAQGRPEGAPTSTATGTLPRVEVSQILRPPDGQRIRGGEAGIQYPAGTCAVLSLSVEGSSGYGLLFLAADWLGQALGAWSDQMASIRFPVSSRYGALSLVLPSGAFVRGDGPRGRAALGLAAFRVRQVVA
jgi:hypothetical protein